MTEGKNRPSAPVQPPRHRADGAPLRDAEAGLVISHLFDRPSPEAVRLAEAAEIWSLRTVPEPDWLAGRPRRRIFHWGLGPALADFQPALRRQGLERYLAENPVELFSFDLGPSARRHWGPWPASPSLGPAAIRRHTEAALKFIRRFYRGPLAVENYNFYPTGLYRRVTEPDFIRRYLEEFDLGLVLDLAHGAVTAHNLRLDREEYFEALPLERVAEAHLSRPELPGTPALWAVDRHLAPQEREWAWLAKLLRNPRLPRGTPVFIEYYRDLKTLEAAQARLTGLVTARREEHEPT